MQLNLDLLSLCVSSHSVLVWLAQEFYQLQICFCLKPQISSFVPFPKSCCTTQISVQVFPFPLNFPVLWKLSSCILIPFLFTRRCFMKGWFFDNNFCNCGTSYWVEAASSWRKFMLNVNSTLHLLPSTFPALGIPLEISIPAPLTAGWKLLFPPGKQTHFDLIFHLFALCIWDKNTDLWKG